MSGGGGLPRLAFLLNGQVDLVPRAETTTANGGRLYTTVPVVPDAPVGHFRLTVFGGKQGYLANTRNSASTHRSPRSATPRQNGKTLSQTVTVKTSCARARKRASRVH